MNFRMRHQSAQYYCDNNTFWKEKKFSQKHGDRGLFCSNLFV